MSEPLERKIINEYNDILKYRLKGRKGYDLTNATINCVLDFSLEQEIALLFSGAIFEKYPIFFSVTFGNLTDFYDTTFNDSVKFEKCTFSNSVRFQKSKLKNVDFSECTFNGFANFRKCEISKSAKISHCTFKDYISFSESTIKNIEFYKSRIEGFTSFREVLIHAYGKLQDTTFSRDVYFNGVPNKRDNINNMGKIIIDDSIFSKNVFFQNSYFHNLVIKNSYFESITNLTNCTFNKLDLLGVIFKENALFSKIKLKHANRETFRIIKHEFKALDNLIEALTYYNREIKEYQKEIKSEKWHCDNRVILFLNNISNSHGVSWKRGILFTVLVGTLFFLPNLFLLKDSYWQWGWNNWSDFWSIAGITTELYTKALYAAHSFDYLKEYNPRGFTFVFDIIGRIFVAYGYYQTISAFRKFSKK